MIEVWGRRNSMNVQKVMWTLGELELDYLRHDIGGSFGMTDEYRAMNPNAVVPTIIDGDLTLYESNACVRYLARSYGFDYLCPADPRAAAIADQWMDWQCSTFSGAFFAVFINKVRTPADQRNEKQMQRGLEQTTQLLRQLDSHLASQLFIIGDALSMADIAIGAHLYRYFEMDIDRPSMPNLRAYYDRLCARDAYRYHVMIPFGSNVEEWQAQEQKNAGIQ
jgi:glutathione S-transferase